MGVDGSALRVSTERKVLLGGWFGGMSITADTMSMVSTATERALAAHGAAAFMHAHPSWGREMCNLEKNRDLAKFTHAELSMNKIVGNSGSASRS